MAGEAVIGALRVSLGLDTAQFSAGLKKTQTSMASFAVSFGKGALSAAAGFLSITAAINGTKEALQKFGDIADKSKAAGVDAEFFQGVAYQAKMAGVDVNTLAGALNTFNKNAGLAAEGKGKLVSQLKALNPELLRNIELARTQEERIRAVADALSKETDASTKAAIATAAFGGEGVKLVAVLEKGAGHLDRMITKAKELGIVVSRDVIARADQLGDEFETAADIVDLKLKQAFIDLAPALVEVAGWAAEFARLMGVAYDQLKAVEDRQFLRPLQNQLAETYNQMQPIKDRIAEIDAALAGGAPNGMILRLDLTEAQGELAALTAQANQLLSRIQELQGYKPPTAPELNSDALPGMFGRGGPGRIRAPTPAEPFYTPGGSSAVTASAKEAATAVTDLMAGIDTATPKVENFAETISDSLASSFSSFADAVLSGVPAVEALGDVLGDLGKQLLNSAISGFFTNLFGGGFGGNPFGGLRSVGGMALYADGGVTNKPAIFGDAGPEAAVPLPDGRTIPVTLSGNAGGGYSEVLIRLDQGMVGQILKQADNNAIKIVDSRAPAAVMRTQRDRG